MFIVTQWLTRIQQFNNVTCPPAMNQGASHAATVWVKNDYNQLQKNDFYHPLFLLFVCFVEYLLVSCVLNMFVFLYDLIFLIHVHFFCLQTAFVQVINRTHQRINSNILIRFCYKKYFRIIWIRMVDLYSYFLISLKIIKNDIHCFYHNDQNLFSWYKSKRQLNNAFLFVAFENLNRFVYF